MRQRTGEVVYIQSQCVDSIGSERAAGTAGAHE